MTAVDQPSTDERTPPARWFAVATVALGIFALVTAEQLPVGLLTSVSGSLHVSEGAAGLMVTVPGLVAALAAPLVPMAAGRTDRRWLLVGLIAVMAAAHLVSAVTPNYALLLVARVLVGLSIGGFWSIAGGLAVRLVSPRSVPRATSIIFGGVAAANVLGVPVGTLLGERTDWRTAFAAMGWLGLLLLLGLLFLLPKLPAEHPVRVRVLVAQWRNAGVRAAVVATFLMITGQFTAYTFVSPALQTISTAPEHLISSVLLGYGVAGIVGNFVAGAVGGRDTLRTVVIISVSLAAVMAVLPVLGGTPVRGIALVVLWGLAYGGVSVTLQTWVLRAAPEATEPASALYAAMFNLSISLGAFVGGVVVDRVSLPAVLWLGSLLVFLTALVAWRTRRVVPELTQTT